MDELEFAASFRPAGPVSIAEVLARASAFPDRADLEEAAAARRAADARVEQRETQAMLNRAAGNPIEHVSRCQAVVAECRAEVDDLESQLERSRAKLRRAAESLVGWQEAAEEVHRASVPRDSDDLLAPAKKALAEARVERMLAAAVSRPVGRPKGEVSRSRGVVVRSENCIHCIEQGASDEEAYLLHSDPEHPLPVTPPGQVEQAAAAERRGHRGYAEISR